MYFHVFLRGQLTVEAGVLENDAESFSDFVRVRTRIEAVDFQNPTRRLQKSGQHLDRRRFARPVGSEKGEDLAPWHFEGDVINSTELTERFCEVFDSNHQRQRSFPISATDGLCLLNQQTAGSTNRRLQIGSQPGRTAKQRFTFTRTSGTRRYSRPRCDRLPPSAIVP